MTIEEIKKELSKMVLNADEAPAIAEKLLTALDELETARQASVTKTEELTQKVKDLQDVNIKLYLSQVSKPQDGGEDIDDAEKSVDELENEFLQMVLGGEKNGGN